MGESGVNSEHVIIIAIIALALAGICLVALLNFLRKKKIREYCEKNLLLYEESPAAMTGYSEAFDVLNQGDYTYYSTGMYGKRGDIELNIVDFTVVTESAFRNKHGRRNKSYKYFTLCQLYRKGTRFPVFFIRDENFILDSLGSMLGGQDIDFAEDKKFSNRFVLQGVNEAEIRRFFTSKVRDAFNQNHKRGYCYESKGSCLLLYTSGHASLEARMEMLNTALKIFNKISSTGFTNNMVSDIPRNPKYYGKS